MLVRVTEIWILCAQSDIVSIELRTRAYVTECKNKIFDNRGRSWTDRRFQSPRFIYEIHRWKLVSIGSFIIRWILCNCNHVICDFDIYNLVKGNFDAATLINAISTNADFRSLQRVKKWKVWLLDDTKSPKSAFYDKLFHDESRSKSFERPLSAVVSIHVLKFSIRAQSFLYFVLP